MILFKSVIQIDVGPMPNGVSQLGLDRLGIRMVTVSRDPLRHYARDRLR